MAYTLRGKISNVTPLTLDRTLTLEGASADAKAVGDAINEAKKSLTEKNDIHANSKVNPHHVTAEQVGLGNCDNTSDLDKPVSTAQAEAIATVRNIATAAQEAADNAQATADDALPKSGGTMTGDIAMGNKKITGLGTPENDGDAVNFGFVTEYVDKSVGATRKTFDAILTTAGWKGSSAPYTQTVEIEGILETDMPHIFPVYSGTLNTAKSERKAWTRVCNAETEDGKVTFSCFDEKPDFAISIQIEVNR